MAAGLSDDGCSDGRNVTISSLHYCISLSRAALMHLFFHDGS